MHSSWWWAARRGLAAILAALVMIGAGGAAGGAPAGAAQATLTLSKHHRCVTAKRRRHRPKHQAGKKAKPARAAAAKAKRRPTRKKSRKRAKCTSKRSKPKAPPKPKPTGTIPGGGSTPPAPAPGAATVPVVPVPCTTTLAPGANVGGAIAAAPPGAGICLTSGSYPQISVSGANPAGYVTVEPAPGASPTVDGVQLSNSSFIRFQQLSLTSGFNMIKSGHDFQFLDNNIGPATYGVVLDGSPSPITNVVVQGNAIHDLDFAGSSAGYAGGQGVTLYNGDNVVVSHNTFWANSWHYIQCGGCDGLAVDHNLFRCPCNEHSGAHLNILQIWQGGSNDSFTNNIVDGAGGGTEICGGCVLLENGAGGQTCSDRYENPNVSNNLFIDPGGSLPIQVNLNDGGQFVNNTIIGGQYGSAFGNGSAPACSGGRDTNMTVAHNIQVGDKSSGQNLWMGNCSGSCVFDYNVTGDTSARADGAAHYVINWAASWAPGTDFQPAGLPFAAGYQGGIGP